MNILIDVRLLGRGGQSGVEEYTRRVVNGLVTHTPYRLTLFYNGWRKQPLPQSWRHSPRTTIIDWHLPNKALRFLPFALDRLAPADVLFSPHVNFLRHGQMPHVLTIHDLSFIHFPFFFSRRQRLWHWLQQISTQARRAARVVTDSQATKEDVVQTLGVAAEKVSVVYPGINPELRHQPGLRPASLPFPYLLYLGTLEPRKNIGLLVQAFSSLKRHPAYRDLKLVLAGRPGWLYREIFHEIRRSPAADDIILWGPVTAEEKLLLYNGAEVFVFPSFFEGFGFPPLEAQACGCPVIVADRSSLPEIVGESALRVSPWKGAQLADAIQALLDDHALRARLRAQGFQNIQRFQWHQCVEELSYIFSSVAR